MKWLASPLVQALRDPARMGTFSDAEWNLLIRQARAADLLGRLSVMLRRAGPSVRLPAGAQRHFAAVDSVVARQHNAVHWEVRQIAQALAGADARVVLLKGAAYAASGGPAAAGRTFSDVDILVPRKRLDAVEQALQVHGWYVEAGTDYDERYYRKWMHELPPMVHLHRQTALDVHHNLLPETARIQTRPDLILSAAQPLPGFDGVYVPTAVDQILHSACHLFHEGEWNHGLRDLSDLSCMLGAYRQDGGDARTLLDRATELNLTVPLAYAVRYAALVFHAAVPDGLVDALNAKVGRSWMDRVFLSAMAAVHPSLSSPGAGAAGFALYVRSHWLRMPLHLLVPHLVHQAFAKRSDESPA